MRTKLLIGVLLLTFVIAFGNLAVGAGETAILGSTKTFNPDNDAYVDQENPDINYGTSSKLIMDNLGNRKYSYLKFDISTIPSEKIVTSANLYLWCDAREGGGYTRIHAYSVEDDNWNETTITWNNRPNLMTFLNEHSGDTLTWWNWDVKAFVENEYGSDRTVSICLVPGDGNKFITEFRSREWGNPEYRPYLEVTYALPATIDIDPDTLTLKKKDRWITAYIELPPDYNVDDIDMSTVRLIVETDNVPAKLKPKKIGDHDSDTIPDLKVKFKRWDVQALASVGEYEAMVIGEVAGVPFQGSDTIRVIPK